jgi:hypothetical protein
MSSKLFIPSNADAESTIIGSVPREQAKNIFNEYTQPTNSQKKHASIPESFSREGGSHEEIV